MIVSQPPLSLISELIIDSDLDMGGLYQVKALATPASGEALRKGNKDIENTEVSNSAAIAYSKLALALSIVNADIAPGAAIAYSKLALALSILNADIAAGAAIVEAKLALNTATPLHIIKAADEIVSNSSTLQNDNELLFAIAANAVYEFSIGLIVTCNTTSYLACAITVPSGAGVNWASSFGTAVADRFLNINVPGYSDQMNSAVGATNQLMFIRGKVVNGSTPGYVQLQWAQQAAQVYNTKIHAGSWILALRLA